MTLAKPENNLNVLRVIAAMMVLIGHSYVFLGLPEPVFLSGFTLGALGVYIFFAVSGYLIGESWDRDPNLLRFFIKRSLRIIPALAVCVTLCVLVLGPWLTTLPLSAYFSSSRTFDYFFNISLYIIYYLPGVFEKLRVANAVNGSLWSLPIEFSLYIALSVIGMCQSNKWGYLILVIGSVLMTNYWVSQTPMLIFYGSDIRQFFMCGTYFWVGSVFYKFGIKKYFSNSLTLLTIAALLGLQFTLSGVSRAGWVLIPLAALSFGFSSTPWLNRWFAKGDYSYGIYIYAFPVQQTVVYLWPDVSIYTYIPLCTLVTLALAMASWHLVEKNALSFKPKRTTASSAHSSLPAHTAMS